MGPGPSAEEGKRIRVALAAKHPGKKADDGYTWAIGVLQAWRDEGRLSRALPQVELSALSDAQLVELVGKLVSSNMSYVDTLGLVETLLLGRILRLEQPASRELFGVLQLVASSYPKAVAEALVVRIFCRRDIGPVQAEVANRVLKETLPEEAIVHFIATVTGAGDDHLAPWGELQVSIMHHAVGRKVRLGSEVFQAVLCDAEKSAGALRKSLKFAKLLLLLMQQYGTHVPSNRDACVRLAEGSETFMMGPIKKMIEKACATD